MNNLKIKLISVFRKIKAIIRPVEEKPIDDRPVRPGYVRTAYMNGNKYQWRCSDSFASIDIPDQEKK